MECMSIAAAGLKMGCENGKLFFAEPLEPEDIFAAQEFAADHLIYLSFCCEQVPGLSLLLKNPDLTPRRV